MTRRIAILADVDSDINWHDHGHVVSDLAELYEVARDERPDLIVVDRRRSEVTPTVMTKLRRSHALMDIWKRSDEPFGTSGYERLDGHLPIDLRGEALRGSLERLLRAKDLLREFGIIGRASALKAIAETIDRVAPTDISVLIVGPSGSGKELVAEAIHNHSQRHELPLVAVNVGAIAESVLESELFGHEKGAFTGSVARREGLFSKANGGTMFLDEIGDMKADLQVKLLRVLEDGTYYPVGSSVAERTDVRVVAATNRDLTEAITERLFREDLYFRLSVVTINLPPLAERRGDVQPLIHYFWREHPELTYSDGALDLLTRYDWPGNIRQLRNFATRMAALKSQGRVEVDDVEAWLGEQRQEVRNLPVPTGRTPDEAGQELIYQAILALGSEIKLLRELILSGIDQSAAAYSDAAGVEPASVSTMEAMEQRLIERALADTNGNRKKAAEKLGIGERTLYRKLNKYGIR